MTKYDVYLGGKATTDWREELKNQIDSSLEIFDPITENYQKFDEEQKANQVAKELEHIEKSEVIAFFLDKDWNSPFSFLQIGDAIGAKKQTIVCINDQIESEQKIRRYCEYRGVLIVNTLEEMIAAIEECLAEFEICTACLKDDD